jgi:large subunit ribosomal protein L25
MQTHCHTSMAVILIGVTSMTLENTVIHAKLRGDASKGTVRKQRHSGLVPGILYKKGVSTKIEIAITNLPKAHTRSSVMKLVLDGVEKTVLMREVQVNPLNDKPIHFDFQEVEPNDLIRTHVPLNFVGLTREQEKEGAFSIRTRYLEVKAPLSKLPGSIEVDVSSLKVEQSIQLHDITLGEGIIVRTGKGKNLALASLVKI